LAQALLWLKLLGCGGHFQADTNTMATGDVAFPLQPHLEVCRVCPADVPGSGTGMRCTEAVRKDEELLAVPVSKCWTAAAARGCPEIAALGEEVLDCLSDQALIALHLLVVANQGSAAEDFRQAHLDYYKSADLETLLDWSDEDLQVLAGSKWAMVAPACKQDIEQEFSELNEVLGEFFAAHGISAAGYAWAQKIVMSRALMFFMEDGSTLLVLAVASELFNRSVDVPVGSSNVQLRRSETTGEQLLTVSACQDHAAGEQALFSYSAASNGRLLMMGGSVVAENPFDSVELMLTFPITAQSLPCYLSLAETLDAGPCKPGAAVAEVTKAEFLETMPLEAEEPTEVALHVRLSRSTLTAQLERVLAFLRLQQLCKGGAAPKTEELAASDADSASRVQALKSLRALLVSMQKQYPQPLDEVDQHELTLAELEIQRRAVTTGGDSGRAPTEADLRTRHKAMAKRVLVGEKKIYREAIEALDKKHEECTMGACD